VEAHLARRRLRDLRGWLWSEREGLGTAQEHFDERAAIPADDPFWAVKIGDPGPNALFDVAAHDRGATTLHALQLTVGDEAFYDILRRWTVSREGDNVATDEFVALAERISGRDLDPSFETWLVTPAKRSRIEPPAARAGAGRSGMASLGESRRAFGRKR